LRAASIWRGSGDQPPVAGYKVYYGRPTAITHRIDVGNATTYTVPVGRRIDVPLCCDGVQRVANRVDFQ
jgi:hypothetical protein